MTKPTFVSYNNGDFKVEWSAPSGCGIAPSQDDPPKHQEPNKDERLVENVGSGIGWFFLVYVHFPHLMLIGDVVTSSSRLLLAFISYFALGMYYNYSTYGATGKDLIP
jgi:autophagy-related protein 27